MAKAPKISREARDEGAFVVLEDPTLDSYLGMDLDADFDDLIDEDIEDDDEDTMTIEEAALSVKKAVEDAVDFMTTEMFPAWENAERFFNGESDVPKQSKRSQVTQTTVRDAIRALKPSCMRVFLQTTSIVEYMPYSASNYVASGVAQQQTKYINQLFWRSNGYMVLSGAVHNAFLKKVGVLKSYAEEVYDQTHMTVTGVTEDELDAMNAMEDIQIVSQTPHRLQDELGLVMVYDVDVVLTVPTTEVRLSHVDLTEFFVDDGATSPDDALVIGQRRNVTVSKAREMGLEYDGEWRDLTSYDTAQNEDSKADAIRRGYMKRNVNPKSYATDLASHIFLLTEAYAEFDLEGTGITQLYRFWLGGEDYRYIAHERVEENPYSVGQIDPIPGAFFGRSIYDVLDEDQNTQTSLLRATCDNAHLANNVRLGVHETLVNMKDVVNPALGAPIRFRSPGMIQPIGVQSSVGSILPLLNHLQMASDKKAGVTNAAMGLDPDALQSTDKDAVKNTIVMGQGQIDLMCRNFAETGVKPAFDKLLRLSIRHKNAKQVVELTAGEYMEINQGTFDPNLVMKTTVGLGTQAVDQKIGGLQAVLAKQEQIIAQMGPANPIVPIAKYHNTIVDLGELMGIANMGRYFNEVTPDVTKAITDQYNAAQEANKPPADPAQTVLQAEQIRAQAKMQENAQKIEADREAAHNKMRERMIELLMKDDLDRDKMIQDLNVEIMKATGQAVNQQAVLAAQAEDRDLSALTSAVTAAQQIQQTRMKQQQQPAPQPQRPQMPPVA